MAYTMDMWVDSACITTNTPNNRPLGASAAIIQHNFGPLETYTAILPLTPPATPERAALSAIILALEQAAEKAITQVFTDEGMLVTVFTDSAFAHGCMTSWIQAEIDERCLDAVRAHTGSGSSGGNSGSGGQGGFSSGNRDLVEHAVNLQAQVEQCGSVTYQLIHHDQNEVARNAVQGALDKWSIGEY